MSTLRSMTGFGRYYLEEDSYTQTWEVRSVNSRHLDLKWRLPSMVRSTEATFEKIMRKHALRGRVEISLALRFNEASGRGVNFNEAQAAVMLGALEKFAAQRGDRFTPEYSQLLNIPPLWEEPELDSDGEFEASLEKGLVLALEDWNESRESEGKALAKDLMSRLLQLREWVSNIIERAPYIKSERFDAVRDRLSEALAEHEISLDENRFLQEITILADKLDVSEELTRLGAHLDRMEQLLAVGGDCGRKLDFTLQECFREINTCGNKIQDAQISRLVVNFKNELEKCREQVQNIE